MPDGRKISGISLYWVCVLLGRGGMQELRHRNDLAWSLQSAKRQCSVVFRAWVSYRWPILVSVPLSPYLPKCHGDNGHGAELCWDSSPDPCSTPRYCITGSIRLPLWSQSCVARQKCCCLLGYTELCGWFLWWVAARWGQRMDVSPDCCDLLSVSHFLCSCKNKKYVGIELSNIGWIFLCVCTEKAISYIW